MVPPSMSEEDAAALFPAGVFSKELPSGKKYLRYTPEPRDLGEHVDAELSQSEPKPCTSLL